MNNGFVGFHLYCRSFHVKVHSLLYFVLTLQTDFFGSLVLLVFFK